MNLEEIKARINPQYADTIGTESHERKWLCDLIELLRQQLADCKKREVMLRNYLERLACLGNGDMHGNSIGNCIAQEALAATEQQSPLDNPVKR